MDNFTGMNPDLARKQLMEFRTYTSDLFFRMDNALNNFLVDLSKNWCSERAVEFDELYGEKLGAATWNIGTAFDIIYRNAVNAYNIMASEMEVELIELPNQNPMHKSYIDNYSYGAAEFREESDSGVVGMNDANVRLARDIYIGKEEAFFNELDNISVDFALYDPGNTLREQYKYEIRKCVENLHKEFDEVIPYLNDAIDTEIHTLFIAKENAVQTMSA